MDLKLALARATGVTDVLVSVEPTVAVGVLAERMRQVDPAADALPDGPLTLAVSTAAGWTSVAPTAEVAASGLRSGCATAVVPLGAGTHPAGDDPVVAVLTVTAGQDEGREFPLRAGEWMIGRSGAADVRLRDPLVSKRHALVRVGRDVRLTDHNSANGTQVDGVTVASARLTPQTRVTVGDTVLEVRLLRAATDGEDHAVVAFNRSPRVEPEFVPLVEDVPEPPTRPAGQAFPFFSILIPIGLGLLIWQVTRSGLAAAFLALSSLLLVGAVLEQAIANRRAHKRARADYRSALAAQRERFAQARAREGELRRFEQPSVAAVSEAVIERTPLLWTRRQQQVRFGQVRLATATRPSRSRLTVSAQRGDPSLLTEANATARQFVDVDDVPVAVDLHEVGALGVSGPRVHRDHAARGVVLQLVALHSPEDLRVAAVVPSAAASAWAWLRWLPHCAPAAPSGGPSSGGASLGADPESCERILSAVEQLVLDRQRLLGASGQADPDDAERAGTRHRLPVLVLVVEDGAPVERGRLVAVAEQGGRVGVHVVWSAEETAVLPAACRSYLELRVDGGATVGHADSGELVERVRTEGVDLEVAESLARLLAPVVDAGAAVDRQADLPRSASFVEHAGRELVQGPTAITERWRETGSLGGAGTVGRRPGTLRALVGQGADAPFHLDLREHGPHALVGGTTGAGKSEFLQSWILGMAVDHSPERVTFLLVDYKGGAAFSEVVRLPHTVGLVTDLTPRLVRRALSSLRAEVRHRERILAAAQAPDLLELERRGDPSAPPALVIVVDEFAALVQEVPAFVDGMIDVAQRGRSLGLHLVLATQRPAGVIKDNLRANTNLRVALRMADEDDSFDVLGTREAALFDPAVPGRAMAKTGPGQVRAFQALYAGGRTSELAPPPDVAVRTLGFGPPVTWEPPEHADAGARVVDGPTDVTRLVEVVRDSARDCALDAPRRPWLPELPAVLDLTDLAEEPCDDELVFGLADDPDRQRQTPAAYRPDEDGAMVVLGTGGSGKSTVLRSLAVAAGTTAGLGSGVEGGAARGGPCHVYGLDFGSHGLSSLEELPHVGGIVLGDDAERVARLLDWLRSVVDERAGRYARVSAGTVEEYRLRTGEAAEPRILLLIDGFGGFRAAYEMSRSSRLYDMVPGLALDGRAVGVHLVLTADRPGVVPPGLAAAAKKRLALRLADDMDLATVGLRTDAFGADTPPGRGYLDGLEVQVAVLGNDPGVGRQVDRMRSLARQLQAAGVGAAPEVGRLTDRVDLSSLAPDTDTLPTLGIAEDTLAAIGFDTSGTFLIGGPPQSGRTTAMMTVVHSLQRCTPQRRLVYFGTKRSPLVGSAGPEWARTATTVEEVADVAAEWASLAAEGVHGPLLGAVIEDLPDFADTPAQEPLERLIGAFASAGHIVVGDGETSALTSSWGLPRAMKSGRHGLLLQPDQEDGDSVLRTSFPRMLRSEFPPGRGMYVRSGRIRKVQVALPA